MPSTSGIHILSELFVVLGYFALNNPDNQVRVPIHLNQFDESIRCNAEQTRRSFRAKWDEDGKTVDFLSIHNPSLTSYFLLKLFAVRQ